MLKDGVINMRIGSIFFVLLGLGLLLGIPRSRRWISRRMLNSGMLRTLGIRIAMRIPSIRSRVVNAALEGPY